MMICDKEGKERFTISTRLYELLMKVKHRILNDDSEYWIALYGGTGCGKSVRAMHFGYVIDKDIDVSQVCFDKEEFIKAVIGAKKGQVIVGDEAISLFFNRSAMTKDSRMIMELINQIRQKNLCIILCIPNILSLDTNIQEKINMGVHVWESRKDGKTVKGHCAFYPNSMDMHQWEKLIRTLKAKRSNPTLKIKMPQPYIREKGDYIGKLSVPVWYPVGEMDYRKKKESILEKYLKKDLPVEKPLTVRQERQTQQRDNAIVLLKEQGLSSRTIAERLGVEYRYVCDLAKKYVNLTRRRTLGVVTGGRNIINRGEGLRPPKLEVVQ